MIRNAVRAGPAQRMFRRITRSLSDVVAMDSASQELRPIRPHSRECTINLPQDYTNPREITWYSCGPTVYDATHIGHARTYVTLDILRTVVERLSQTPVKYCVGVTDIDDKIIQRAKELNIDWRQLAKQHEIGFFADMAALGVRPPTCIVRVSEHIDRIVSYIKELIDAGFAYRLESGWYFDTRRYGPAYGALGPAWAKLPSDGNAEIATADAEPTAAGKRDARDFALWKYADASANQVGWPSSLGYGRPGWHIECSAMTHAVFGDRLDVHAGGVDLMFPHHCNEIAQSCAHSGKQEWVNVFLHTGHVHIEGRKMSKSLKNFITVREMLGDNPDEVASAFRWLCMMHHYRANITFNTG
jgi:cysteinyl-tRNA synthetase